VRYRLHRNSQKRIYVDQGIYFITTNTYQSFPYFSEDIFCELFEAELELCKKLKGFEVYGYKINPQHVHLLIQTGEKFDFSNVMGALKRNFSRDCNTLMNDGRFIRHSPKCGETPPKGDDSNRRLLDDDAFKIHVEKLNELHQQFINKYGQCHKFPPFKWQKSFHFHVVNNQRDFTNHLRYIDNQWIKHDLKENKFCYIGAALF